MLKIFKKNCKMMTQKQKKAKIKVKEEIRKRKENKVFEVLL